MCGILGIIDGKEGIKVKEVIELLKMLEYRGYDSWGLAYENQNKIHIIKKIGAISEEKDIKEGNIHTTLAIAHTRWATHGGVDEKNTHPHLSMNKKVVLVHNGIIENFKTLKGTLLKEGYSFYGETDSEVIANLIERELLKIWKNENQNINITQAIKALKNSLLQLHGSYALAMIIDDMLIGAAKDSPLVVGTNTQKNRIYVGSDAKSFIRDVDKLYVLKDGDIFVATKKGITFYNLYSSNYFSPAWENIKDPSKYGEWEPLNGYPYYTIKEIEEQKQKIAYIIEYVSSDLKKAVEMIKKSRGIFFVASGSSYNACVCASYIFSSLAHMHVNVVDASEFKYYKHFLTPDTLIIAVSQSGETADVIESVKTAKKSGAKVISITNTYGSSLYRLADIPLLMHVGSEISVIATKTYTAQLYILTILAYLVSSRTTLDELKKKAQDLKTQLETLLSQSFYSKIYDVCTKIKDKEHLYIIGRGISYASALEGALKIKEISYIHAEAFAGGALKHGSIALIEPGTYVIAIAPEDETYDEIISNVLEVKARGAKVIGITTKHNDVFDAEVIIPKNDMFQAILNIIPLQLMAYRLALLRNLNPDKPRNLAKSVTVK